MAKKSSGTITKMEAVRRVLAEMGKDAKPAQMQPVIKERFGFDMSTDHIGVYKGTILKNPKKKPSAKPAAAPAPPATPAAPRVDKAGSIDLADIQATKELVDRVGADRLRALIALFAN